MRTLTPLHETPGFPEAFAAALTRVETTTYVIADTYTHAPITPYAPIPGALGIRAGIERRATAAKNVGTCDCPGGPFHEAIRVAWGDTFQAVTRHD